MTKEELRAKLDKMRRERVHDDMNPRMYLEEIIEIVFDCTAEILAEVKK